MSATFVLDKEEFLQGVKSVGVQNDVLLWIQFCIRRLARGATDLSGENGLDNADIQDWPEQCRTASGASLAGVHDNLRAAAAAVSHYFQLDHMSLTPKTRTNSRIIIDPLNEVIEHTTVPESFRIVWNLLLSNCQFQNTKIVVKNAFNLSKLLHQHQLQELKIEGSLVGLDKLDTRAKQLETFQRTLNELYKSEERLLRNAWLSTLKQVGRVVALDARRVRLNQGFTSRRDKFVLTHMATDKSFVVTWTIFADRLSPSSNAHSSEEELVSQADNIVSAFTKTVDEHMKLWLNEFLQACITIAREYIKFCNSEIQPLLASDTKISDFPDGLLKDEYHLANAALQKAVQALQTELNESENHFKTTIEFFQAAIKTIQEDLAKLESEWASGIAKNVENGLTALQARLDFGSQRDVRKRFKRLDRDTENAREESFKRLCGIFDEEKYSRLLEPVISCLSAVGKAKHSLLKERSSAAITQAERLKESMEESLLNDYKIGTTVALSFLSIQMQLEITSRVATDIQNAEALDNLQVKETKKKKKNKSKKTAVTSSTGDEESVASDDGIEAIEPQETVLEQKSVDPTPPVQISPIQTTPPPVAIARVQMATVQRPRPQLPIIIPVAAPPPMLSVRPMVVAAASSASTAVRAPRPSISNGMPPPPAIRPVAPSIISQPTPSSQQVNQSSNASMEKEVEETVLAQSSSEDQQLQKKIRVMAEMIGRQTTMLRTKTAEFEAMQAQMQTLQLHNRQLTQDQNRKKASSAEHQALMAAIAEEQKMLDTLRQAHGDAVAQAAREEQLKESLKSEVEQRERLERENEQLMVMLEESTKQIKELQQQLFDLEISSSSSSSSSQKHDYHYPDRSYDDHSRSRGSSWQQPQRIFITIKNISDSINSDELRKFLFNCRIVRIHFPRDEITNKRKQHAIVVLADQESVQIALSYSGQTLDGQQVSVIAGTSTTEQKRRLPAINCSNCGERGHESSRCTVACRYCLQTTHLSDACPTRKL